jgi:hypothetical protein
MAENILLKQAPVGVNIPTGPKHKTSVVGVILAFFLFIALTLLGERILFDLNRFINPVIQKVQSSGEYYNSGYGGNSYIQYASESSGLSDVRIYYKSDDKTTYTTYKLLIHSAFVIPAFLLVFLFYYLYIVKNANYNLKVVSYAYFAFAFWMIIHLLGELGIYIVDQFQDVAVYIILGFLVIIMTVLALFIQKKINHQLPN